MTAWPTRLESSVVLHPDDARDHRDRDHPRNQPDEQAHVDGCLVGGGIDLDSGVEYLAEEERRDHADGCREEDQGADEQRAVPCTG